MPFILYEVSHSVFPFVIIEMSFMIGLNRFPTMDIGMFPFLITEMSFMISLCGIIS